MHICIMLFKEILNNLNFPLKLNKAWIHGCQIIIFYRQHWPMFKTKCFDGTMCMCVQQYSKTNHKLVKNHDTSHTVLSSVMALQGKIFEAPDSPF